MHKLVKFAKNGSKKIKVFSIPKKILNAKIRNIK